MINEDFSPLIAPKPAPVVTTNAEGPTQITGPQTRAEVKSIANLVNKLGDGGTGHSVTFFRLATDARTALAPLSSARLLARDRLVVLVNLVEDLPDLPGLMSDRHALGLTDLVAGKVSFGDVIGRDRLSRAHVIPHGGAEVDTVTVIESKRFLTMVNALQRTYDHVIIDAGLIADAPIEKMSTFASRAVLVTAGTEAVEEIPAQDCLLSAGYAELVVLVDAPQASRKRKAA
jgi:Mrp family chromosome partitioning ATPase